MTDPEFEARQYAQRVVLILFSCIGGFMALASVSIFWLFVVVALMFLIMLASALYTDSYYHKLLELKQNETSNSETGVQ